MPLAKYLPYLKSMLSSEHLFPVPFHKLLSRIIFFNRWQRNRLSRKIPEQSLYHPTTIYRVGNIHTHIFIQTNRTTIKRFMMDCAQRQAVRYFTRAMVLLPSDMVM
ncbi:hypothetical protein FH42_19870 [Klebsiella pneumoniae]|nr:hypothetical protein FH42_19870 [Klebsiella pneumoniae]